jgi:hypothetical protein
MPKYIKNTPKNVDAIYLFINKFTTKLVNQINSFLDKAIPDYITPILQEEVSITATLIVDRIIAPMTTYADRSFILSKVLDKIKTNFIDGTLMLSEKQGNAITQDDIILLADSFEKTLQERREEDSVNDVEEVIKNTVLRIDRQVNPELLDKVMGVDKENMDQEMLNFQVGVYKSFVDFITSGYEGSLKNSLDYKKCPETKNGEGEKMKIEEAQDIVMKMKTITTLEPKPGYCLAKPQSWLPCSKESVREAYFVYSKFLIENNLMTEPLKKEIIKSCTLIHAFVDDKSAERINKTNSLIKNRKFHNPSMKDPLLNEYFYFMQNSININPDIELSNYICECQKK